MRFDLDKVVNPKAYIWRPTVSKTAMEDYLKCFVAWPANSVVFESNTQNSPHLQQSVSSTSKTQKSPLSAASSAKQPAASSKAKSMNEESPSTPPALTNKPAGTQKKKSPVTPTSPLRRSERNKFKPNQKVKLLDLSENKVIVAEGRWSSNNPEHLVHFEPLGPGGCRIFVDVVKVKDAAVWRTTSEIEYMEDALGSCLAWPEDKVVMA
ncbi:uncharacterized protein LOC106417195 [Brassica napus]|uniref:uncharacterized protein LOC106417195 n=1 Tax=Brassica napus TaxID=3708 RepID=UPI0006AA6CBA|nr:uncharacterized protein LOC106417195 [Brassica napus]